VAVAEIVGADLGWVILLGIVAGLPTAIVAGPLFGSYISRRIVVQTPAHALESLQARPAGSQPLPSFGLVAVIMGAPLVLILGSTASQLLVKKGIVTASAWTQAAAFAGHPFTALLVSTLLALYLLGVRRGFGRAELMELSSKALAPAGLIILITGAGGVLKQVLIDSGIGKILAEAMSHGNLPPILLAWLLAVAVRIAQGSSTVAMITAAGIIAPMIANAGLSDAHLGLVVISIASGATILSHVNDSGFWLVGKYFGLSEKQTLQSWTVMETIIAFCGLAFTLLLSWIL
jgi:Gnt-I system low-affinity gluconate transporter